MNRDAMLRGKRCGCLRLRLCIDDADRRVAVIGPAVSPVGALLHAQQQVKALGELHHLLVRAEWLSNQIAPLLVDLDPL